LWGFQKRGFVEHGIAPGNASARRWRFDKSGGSMALFRCWKICLRCSNISKYYRYSGVQRCWNMLKHRKMACCRFHFRDDGRVRKEEEALLSRSIRVAPEAAPGSPPCVLSAGSVSDVSGVATGLQSLQVESREMEWSKVQLEFQPACHALHVAIYVLLHRVNRNGLAQNGIYRNLSNLTKKRVLRETSRMIFTFVFVRKFWEHPSKKHKSHGFKNHKVITKMEGTFARKPWYWLVKLMISCRLTDYPNDFTK